MIKTKQTKLYFLKVQRIKLLNLFLFFFIVSGEHQEPKLIKHAQANATT